MGVSKFDPLQLKQASTTTVKDLFEKYRDEVGVSMKGRNEVGTLNRLIRDCEFMRLRADRITPNDIREWRDARAKQVQPASVQREKNTISAVFTYAIKECNAPMRENPCHLVSTLKGSDKVRTTGWSSEDVAKYLKACEWSEDKAPVAGRDYVGWAFLLALETAMRIGELCLPTVADFHSDEQYIHLRDTKNGDERNVPLSVKAIKYFTVLCQNKNPGDKIIPLKADTLGEYAYDVRKKAGLTHLVFHDTRRTATTNLSKKLSNVLELAAVTGHRSLKVLQKTYYSPVPADLASKLG